AKLDAEKDEQRKVVAAFLKQLRSFILTVELDPAFVKELRSRLESTFGAVGTTKIFEALRQVWASPFTERSYAWRQSRMQNPEYVFPAVLIQYSFPAEKSGVLVTADLEEQEAGCLTVAVNEGVGGAVEGQAAESLHIRVADKTVRFLSRASAPFKS